MGKSQNSFLNFLSQRIRDKAMGILKTIGPCLKAHIETWTQREGEPPQPQMIPTALKTCRWAGCKQCTRVVWWAHPSHCGIWLMSCKKSKAYLIGIFSGRGSWDLNKRQQ